MAKAKTSAFFCQNCGYESSKWMGQCPACREWNTFVEELVDRKALSTSGKIKPATEAKPVPLSAIKTSDEERISTSSLGGKVHTESAAGQVKAGIAPQDGHAVALAVVQIDGILPPHLVHRAEEAPGPAAGTLVGAIFAVYHL